jgi:hypothetical protein
MPRISVRNHLLVAEPRGIISAQKWLILIAVQSMRFVLGFTDSALDDLAFFKKYE